MTWRLTTTAGLFSEQQNEQRSERQLKRTLLKVKKNKVYYRSYDNVTIHKNMKVLMCGKKVHHKVPV